MFPGGSSGAVKDWLRYVASNPSIGANISAFFVGNFNLIKFRHLFGLLVIQIQFNFNFVGGNFWQRTDTGDSLLSPKPGSWNWMTSLRASLTTAMMIWKR